MHSLTTQAVPWQSRSSESPTGTPIYSTLKTISENIDTYCQDDDKIINDTINKVYSHIQSGRKIKASIIYGCDSISAKKNQCINKYHTDWDWTSRIYPRSTLELMRPYPHNDEYICPRTPLDDITLKKHISRKLMLALKHLKKLN